MIDFKQISQWANKNANQQPQSNKTPDKSNNQDPVNREALITVYASRMAKVAYNNIKSRTAPDQRLEGTPVPHIILPAQAILHLLTINDPGVFAPDGNKFSDAEMYLFATHFIPELTILILEHNEKLSNKQ